MNKRSIGIQKLLEWAFREELPFCRNGIGEGFSGPQAPPPVWAAMAGAGDARVSDGRPALNRWGLVTGGAGREPHPDALRVGEAVLALDALALDLPEGWEESADLCAGIEVRGEGALTPLDWAAAGTRALARIAHVKADHSRALRDPVSRLIIRAATMGRAPDVPSGTVTRRVVLAANGRPAWFARELVPVGEDADGHPRMAEVEVNGLTRNGRQKPGAYQKFEVTPDPATLLVARAEYEVWRAALDVLAEDLDGVLDGFIVRPSRLPMRPWLEKAAHGPVVHPDIQGGSEAFASTPVRPLVLAGPPLSLWRTPSDLREKIKQEAYLRQRDAYAAAQASVKAKQKQRVA